MTTTDLGNAPHAVRTAARRIARRVVAENAWEVSYKLDLALEGVLAFGAAAGEPDWRAHVEDVARRRGWEPSTAASWRKEPFVSLWWAWAEARNDDVARRAFVDETRREVAEIWRSDDGLILHPRGEVRGGGYAVLIDSFAEYVSRTARAAKIANDGLLAGECAQQVTRHRALLRDPQTGLWSQGRGWLADRGALSPGAWSRGQGWLMRGFSDAVQALPRGSEAYGVVLSAMRELADALLPRQDASGLWHALVHRAQEESGVETSGTGLIAAALLRAVAGKHLPAERYEPAALRALHELVRHVDDAGVVHDACVGPGPLEQEAPWLVLKFPPGDPHGPGTVLGALMAGWRA